MSVMARSTSAKLSRHARNFEARLAALLQRVRARRELEGLSPVQVRALERDLSTPVGTLLAHIEAGEEIAPLLGARLQAAGLSLENIEREHASVAKDMRDVCARCSTRSACQRQLSESGTLTGLGERCPNTSTVAALAQQEASAKAGLPNAGLAAWPLCC